ncbi:uncharacterized protein C16orf78 homolog isoform X1 [Leopardus geoffroyi]|uniref:uncharacterized protein C16orf78 homolog isoform X1 n=1 Tax=Leopardus geoffroyi TaxID=46844 RepID=UPI001E2644F7|nr:uncharacterized protein C16orf78 homolog isoform X1 [Leopardus geoffroyi]
MTEPSEYLKDSMPTERKSVWRTSEERRMSDLTRVLEWLQRRQGKKKQTFQKPNWAVPPKTTGKEEKKGRSIPKKQKGNHQAAFSEKTPEQGTKKDKDHVMYQKLKGKRLSLVPGSYSRDNPKKSELDIKDAIVLESTQRSVPYHRQSIIDPMLQDPLFSTRRSTLLRDWVVGRMPEVSYERKLKSLMEKGAEPKVETVRMLKPEEVLSCRYLRLSKNNIRTLLKLCKDAGMNVDIHPHMVEGEIDAKKFSEMQMKNTRQYH